MEHLIMREYPIWKSHAPYPKTASIIGVPALLEQLAEECDELGQAALKMARVLRKENPTPTSEAAARVHLAEEAADVMVCLIELSRVFFDVDQNGMIREQKIIRWHDRLKDAKYHEAR